jgi:hypothetical protein
MKRFDGLRAIAIVASHWRFSRRWAEKAGFVDIKEVC